MSPATTLGRRLRLGVRALQRFRPDLAWFLGVLRSFVVSFLALTLTIAVLPGTQVTRGTQSVATLAVALLAVGALLRPLLTRLTVLTGTVGLLVAGLVAQSLILGLALHLVPTVRPFTFTEIFLAAWGAAVAAAAVNWLFDASSDEAFLGQVMGQGVALTRRHGHASPGLLVVQLDGVSEPLLRQAITSGTVPTLARWLRSQSHELRRWHTGLPATTPAGQAVLLHGDTTAIPSFRWYDKQLGRLVVSSQPTEAARVEAELSDGRGLLADGGVSVSNLLSGDAPTRILTVSDARIPSREQSVARYAVARGGFVRSFVLTIGQMIAEWHQGRRQRLRDVVPRVRRSGDFVLLRGVTTVMLHDVTVSVVAEHMARSAPVIYVDFVDYDEVAHHAGPTRPESMRTLEGLDRVLGFFEELGEEVRSDYEIVVVSDHGQSQGVTFEQLAHQSLAQLVHDLTAAPVLHDDEPDVEHTVLTGERPRRRQAQDEPFVVAASGSLAHLYVTDLPGRATLEQICGRSTALVEGLVAHPQVGVVMARTDHGLRVMGATGWRDLTTDAGEGDDPLASYGPVLADDLLALDRRDHVGDLVLLGAYDTRLDEVVAFEELVGSHGGAGGWQTEALLVHPSDWAVPPPELTGHDLTGPDVHRLLVDRLDTLGLRRTGLRTTGPTS